MNLKGVYEIFYPKKSECKISVWKEKPKHRTKQEFFEALIPMEMRWLNPKLWNDKARRSRFFSDSKLENKYSTLLRDAILQNEMLIPRMEGKGQQMLQGNICGEQMEKIFFRLAEEERIELSLEVKKHLIDMETGRLKPEWGNVLTFLVLYAIFPGEVNQLYGAYLYKEENTRLTSEKKTILKDRYLFQSEYPPDMNVYRTGDLITHTWIIKNTGEVCWENRYMGCDEAPFPLDKENMQIPIPEMVYPGDMIFPTVRFRAPETPGTYAFNWKMKDRDGNQIFLDKLGVGLHFTVIDGENKTPEREPEGENNYKVLKGIPEIPVTVEAGKIYSHTWTIQNTGTVVWKDYYCECINAECFYYTRNELRINLKKRVEPGEQVSVMAEFVTLPTEGVYRLIWRIMDGNGRPVFSEGRQLEILLNLI